VSALSKYQNRLSILCDQYKVESLYVYGSAVTGQQKPTSDIDLLVKFKPFDIALYFDNYMTFKNKLSRLFNREVDLLEEQALRNPVLIDEINKTKELVYG
jgi:predicted nucleotidyltransferase